MIQSKRLIIMSTLIGGGESHLAIPSRDSYSRPVLKATGFHSPHQLLNPLNSANQPSLNPALNTLDKCSLFVKNSLPKPQDDPIKTADYYVIP
ncbi:hypothetical protein CDAR_292361 [Caerostris darwini]|uniref:Uncharacterized protein n=1 Tax=Caerostris darwini TaxID=1538125 RepID=A0AAV4UCY1_9ARAC|nr:hypothetical protein CDAR_292361 [Caerostris darwini]